MIDGKLPSRASTHNVLHGFSLLQCISEYFESPAAVSMETREADVTGGYPEHAQICLFEPVSDADYVFSSIHSQSIFIN